MCPEYDKISNLYSDSKINVQIVIYLKLIKFWFYLKTRAQKDSEDMSSVRQIPI